MNDESDALGSLDGEATTATRYDINRQMSVAPVLKLLFCHPETDFLRTVLTVRNIKNPQAHITLPGVKFTQREAHRCAAIAATTGLVKHEGAMNTPQLLK